MVKAFFISDLHIDTVLDAREIEKQDHILRFLKDISRQATHLFIVGDLFDFWFEYKTVIPRVYFRFLIALKEMREAGTNIVYLAGNHDFALGTFFPRELDIPVYLDDYTCTLEGKKFYLFHGDGLARKDSGYRFLKRILRNRFNQRLFGWIHPDVGFKLARIISGSSRKYTNQLNWKRDEQDYFDFARQKFKEGFDYVLMGHRHNPLVHEIDGHKYINLGDWIDKFSYAVFDGKMLQLEYYPLKEK